MERQLVILFESLNDDNWIINNFFFKKKEIPQYLYEVGWTNSGKIVACTQVNFILFHIV